MTRRAVDLLLVEDDPGDVELLREALKDSKVPVHLHVVQDGAEALRYLQKEGAYADALRPDLVLLDLNLPIKDGHEVLRQLKQDDRLRIIPVVILSTSDEEKDIVRSYGSGVNCYVTKPGSLDQLMRVMRSIECFWFTTVRLPRAL